MNIYGHLNIESEYLHMQNIRRQFVNQYNCSILNTKDVVSTFHCNESICNAELQSQIVIDAEHGRWHFLIKAEHASDNLAPIAISRNERFEV